MPPAPPPPALPTDHKLADIEALRGIAVLLVMLDHLVYLFAWTVPILDRITSDYLRFNAGVDIFFVISGFVIARNLLPSLRQARTRTDFFFAVYLFWIRRAWRLLPAAWLWVGITLLLSVFLNRTGVFLNFPINFASSIADILAVANARVALTFPYYGATIHYWSLSLEEQFYLVLPLFVLLADRRLVAALLLLAAILFALPSTIWVASFRAGGLVCGVLLALLAEQPFYALLAPAALGRSRVARLAVLAGVLLLIGSLQPTGSTILPRHHIGLTALLATILVFVASFGRHYLVGTGRAERALVYVGSRSYALYLCHLPIYMATREIWLRLGHPGHPGAELRFLLTALPLTFAAAELNYRHVERPLRALGRRIASRQPAWSGASGVQGRHADACLRTTPLDPTGA